MKQEILKFIDLGYYEQFIKEYFYGKLGVYHSFYGHKLTKKEYSKKRYFDKLLQECFDLKINLILTPKN